MRDEAEAAARRSAVPPPRRRAQLAVVDEIVAARIRDAAGGQHGAKLIGRLSEAAAALERERFDEARRGARALLDELPDVAAVHRVAGLAAYRLGRWKEASDELVAAEELEHSVTHLPVLADAYRAQRRWRRVEEIWSEIRAASPAHETMAEGRIVAAGAAADQGDLVSAIKIMQAAPRVKSGGGGGGGGKVRDHHLRQWYVLADLHDRAGDAIEAARLFGLVAEHDPEFVDVRARLDALGR